MPPKAGLDRTRVVKTAADLVNSLFETRGFDYVFHLAAYAAEGLSHFIKAGESYNT